MSDERSQLTKELTDALPYLTDSEFSEIAATVRRKANWNKAMRRGLELAGQLRKSRKDEITHASYNDLLGFARQIGMEDKGGAVIVAELWYALALTIARIPRSQPKLARDTPLEVKSICRCANVNQVNLKLRPAVRQLLTVWVTSFWPILAEVEDS